MWINALDENKQDLDALKKEGRPRPQNRPQSSMFDQHNLILHPSLGKSNQKLNKRILGRSGSRKNIGLDAGFIKHVTNKTK